MYFIEKHQFGQIIRFTIFVALKKAIAIFLLLQVVTNNAFAEELIKLPGLITHFYHHTTEHNESGNFFDYLCDHYSDQQQKNNHRHGQHEEDKDCELPFKHCGSCCVNIHSPALGFVASYLSTDCDMISIEAENFFPEEDDIQSLDLNNIWQPPKIS